MSAKAVKNLKVDKAEFDALLGRLIATPASAPMQSAPIASKGVSFIAGLPSAVPRRVILA